MLDLGADKGKVAALLAAAPLTVDGSSALLKVRLDAACEWVSVHQQLTRASDGLGSRPARRSTISWRTAAAMRLRPLHLRHAHAKSCRSPHSSKHQQKHRPCVPRARPQQRPLFCEQDIKKTLRALFPRREKKKWGASGQCCEGETEE